MPASLSIKYRPVSTTHNRYGKEKTVNLDIHIINKSERKENPINIYTGLSFYQGVREWSTDSARFIGKIEIPKDEFQVEQTTSIYKN